MPKFSNIIFFQGGSYGTLMEWACTTAASDSFDSPLPLTDIGSSHLYHSNFIDGPEILDYVAKPSQNEFCNMHPGIFRDDPSYVFNKGFTKILNEDLEFLQKHFSKILVLHPDKSCMLQVENNDLTKSFISEDHFKKYYEPRGVNREEVRAEMTDDFVLRIRHMIDDMVRQPGSPFSADNLQQWGAASIYDFQLWELRELLSYSWTTQVSGIADSWVSARDSNKNSNILFMSVTELNNQFVQSMTRCLNHFGIPKSEKLNQFLESIYVEWLPRQKHINKDAVIARITKSIETNEHYDWSDQNLTILDEAFIQKSLRDLGLELACCGLSVFPTNTDELRKYIRL